MDQQESQALARFSQTDRLLIDELLTLERAMARNYAWVYELIAPYLGRSLVEVGSGVGVISRYLVERGTPVILSDRHPVYLDYLRSRFERHPHVTIRILDLNDEAYDLGGHSVDTVVCLNVIEHVADDQAVLGRLGDVLSPGGRLVLQVPNYPALFGTLDEAYGHCRRYTRSALTEKLIRAGFAVLAIRNFNPLAIPGWIVAGKLLRRRHLSEPSLWLFNGLVPLARRLDFLSRFGGLALIACAERRALS